MRTSRLSNATTVLIRAAVCLMAFVLGAVPARTAAAQQDISARPMAVPSATRDAGHSIAALLSVPESPDYAGRCGQDNVSELPFMAPRESGPVAAELVQLECPPYVSMAQLNPDMYADLVEEVCGDHEGP